MTILQQLCDVNMSIWTKISEECVQHLVGSMKQRIKEVPRSPMQYSYGRPIEVPQYTIQYLLSVQIDTDDASTNRICNQTCYGIYHRVRHTVSI